MINYNWNHPDNVLHMGIGLSCCPSPHEADLSKVWSRHRTSLIDLFSSLQGIHVIVENLDHRFTDGEMDAFAYIREMDLKLYFKNGIGHIWHLLPNGTYTIEVTVPGITKPMIKYMVPVQVAEFQEVYFLLPSNQMMPKFFLIFMMACISMVMLIGVVMFCRCCARGSPNNKWFNKIEQHNSLRGSKGRSGKSHHRPSYDGFQLLTRGGGKSKSLFEDDDESDEDMLDKSMKQYGLKMPPTKIYRDEFSSQSSDDEFPRNEDNTFLHNRHNNIVGGKVGIVGSNRKVSHQEKWPPKSSQETILNM
jgi:hypothetical protein